MLWRILWGGLVLLVLGFLYPIVKDWFDLYTAPTTGILIGNVNDTTLAAMTFVPWYIWIIAIIAVVLYVIIPREPEMPSYPQLRLPKPPKQPKKRPPMM